MILLPTIENQRCIGNTTRQIDYYIQRLFHEYNKVEKGRRPVTIIIRDHAHIVGNMANKDLLDRLRRRLYTEHSIMLKEAKIGGTTRWYIEEDRV